jgi:glutathione S-transferase
MTKLVLYHYPMSLCSQKVRLCLAELGLSYVPRPVSRISNPGTYASIPQESCQPCATARES